MRGYFKYYSYFYDTEKLTLTVNNTELDPVYLAIERVVMLQSSAVDALIILHKAMNFYELSKLKLDDFTLSMNISMQMEKVYSMNAIQFGANVIVGLGVNSGFKLIKISPQMDYDIIDIDGSSVTAISFFIKNSNFYVVVGTERGEVILYRLRESWDTAEELVICEELAGNGAISNLVFPERLDREVLVSVSQGGKYPCQLAFILFSYPWNSCLLVKRLPGTRLEAGNVSAMVLNKVGSHLFLVYDFISKKRDLQVIQLDKDNVREVYKAELRSDSKITGILPLGDSINVKLLSESGVEETIYNGSLELEEELISIPVFTDWFNPTAFPYHKHITERISEMRFEFNGQIFFDKLLEIIGVSAALYPPRTAGQLKNLFSAVLEASDVDILRKHCLIYYLLKDLRSDKHVNYAHHFDLTPSFRLLMDGLWALDHGLADEALQCLSNPSVVPDWCPEIARALFSCKKPENAMLFIHVSGVELKEEVDMYNQMSELLRKDLTLAFLFQRSVENPAKQSHLFTGMLDWCFKSKSNQSNIQKLLELAFSLEEEKTLHTYCMKSDVPAAQNFLFMYYLSRSRFREAIAIHNQIIFDKKRDQIVEKLIKTVPNLRNEVSNIKRNITERVAIDRKNLIVDDDQSIIMLQEPEETPADSLKTHEKADESLMSFKIVSQTATLEQEDISGTSDTSDILTGSLGSGEQDDRLKSMTELQSNERRISISDDSDGESRSISPIPRQSLCMDADSVMMAPDFYSDLRNSSVNITPLASVLKDESMKDITETPKSKITITSSLKNISPFHQIVEPPKTARKAALGTPPQPKRMAKVESPILLRSRLRNAVKNKSPEADINKSIMTDKRIRKKSKDAKTSLKLRGKAPSPPKKARSPPKARSPLIGMTLLKSKPDVSPQERKLHTPIKNKMRLKNLDSPEPLRSGRFSLRKTPARLKYLEEHLVGEDSTGDDSSIPEYTPLRTAGIGMNQLRGSNDISTPAVNVLENARMTRLRAKEAIQRK